MKLSESNAIAYYLADSGPKREQLLGSTVDERAIIQHWIFFSELQVEPTLWKVAVWRRGRAPYNAEAEALGTKLLPQWLDYLENGLKDKKWLAGDTAGPSLADLTIASVIFFGYVTYIDADMRAAYPDTFRWFEQIRAIPELTELFTGDMVENRQEAPLET